MGSAPKPPKPAYVPPPMQPSPTAKASAQQATMPLQPQNNAGTILTGPLGIMGNSSTTGKTLIGQ